MKKGIVFGLILAFITYSAIVMLGDVRKALPTLKAFPLTLVPAIAVFGFCNDLIKFFRWDLYLKKTGFQVKIARSLGIFLTGLSMSATPGKAGFLLKAQFLKTATGRTLIAGSPVVIAELLMDLVGLSVISLLGVSVLGGSGWTLLLCCLPMLMLARPIPERLLDLASRSPFLAARAHELKGALDDMFALFGPKVLVISLVITLAAWTSEGVALHLIARGLGHEIGIIDATVIFGFSTLVGAVSFIPGGLVVTDASLLGLLIHAGMPAPDAGMAAIMARVFTLWLSVAIGSIFLILNRKSLYARTQEAL
ncbi:MAG TPA: lysylphosphatidylglycerol synthase transmembrane domain-containing protein [Deltaproteobacteria bacterium]|nr:lysylphosphatidylglycerol synthase transmembrane domain-containing protein [Deltaproteobacteria bacterium]